MAYLTVTTPFDVVSPGDGQLSLREALAQANGSGGPDTIRFAATVVGKTLVLTGGELTVSDDGVGIDAANRDRLFEKGFSTKSGGKRGVGLHWCANAVNAMGGRLSVESDGPQQGATFRITLPAALSRRDAA